MYGHSNHMHVYNIVESGVKHHKPNQTKLHMNMQHIYKGLD